MPSESRATAADVFYAYRLILGRDPDSEGLMHHLRKIDKESIPVADLRREFLLSPELGRQARHTVRVETGGVSVYVDPLEPEFGRSIAVHARWEPHIRGTIERRLREGDVFVDVGANIGMMALPIARHVGPTGKVIGFEPNPDNVQCFLQGVAANKFQNVVLYPFPLSDRREIFSLAGHSNSVLRTEDLHGTYVQSMIGDDILDHETRIDFIKMDIEGHEPRALKGLARAVQRHQPDLLCEFNPRCLTAVGSDTGQFAHELFALDRRCVVLQFDGTETEVSSADELLALWRKRNLDVVRDGVLPDGMLHFDLLFPSARRDAVLRQAG